MNNIFLEQLKQYENQWVALSPDQARVIASGKDAREAKQHAQQQGTNDVVLFRVPPFNIGFAPDI